MIIISHKNRINLLATYLIEHEYVSILDIKNEFNISRRSAFYWINDLNEKLDEMELDQLNNLTQSKYFLSSETKMTLVPLRAAVSTGRVYGSNFAAVRTDG